MGYASHRQLRRRQQREELSELRQSTSSSVSEVATLMKESRAFAKRADAWKRTVAGIVAEHGGSLCLTDTCAESVGPSDRLQVTRDEGNKTTTFTLIRGGADE